MNENDYDPTVKAEISVNGESVVVTFDYEPTTVKTVKKVPSARFIPRGKPEGPGWRLNLDLATMRALRDRFDSRLVLGKELKRWGHRKVEEERNLGDLSDANDAELKNISKKFQKWLRPYQRADTAFMAETNVINANQPRTGKTPTTIAAVIEAGMEWGCHLVFAPVQALRNVWEDGIKQAYKLQGLDEPTILTGDNPGERRDAIEEAIEMYNDGNAFWLVLNPYMGRVKNVRKGKGEEAKIEKELVAPGLIEMEWDTITIDEFHLCGLSNPTTQSATGINQIAEATQPDRKYALSGTPMGGKPIKLWGALHFLNPEEFTSRWHWARHWLVINSNDFGSSIEGIMPGREMDFYDHLKPYLVRRTQREALPGLPPVNRIDVWCGMTPNQAEQYTRMATEAEWAIEDAEERDGRVSATNILSLYTRLKQFADAYCDVKRTGKETELGLPELEISQTQDSGKIEQLLEKLEECNVIGTGEDDDELACALISSQFNAMCRMMVEVLTEKGVPVEYLIAGKKKQNDEIVDRFQAGGPDAPRVLVMNTLMGTALTLDRAETVHILDETWVPDNQEQMESRALPTTEELMAKRVSVGVYYYRTRGSIEEYIQILVRDKDLNNRTILDMRRRLQAAMTKDKSEVERGRELIAKWGSLNQALHKTHPDHGGNPDDFRAVMAARIADKGGNKKSRKRPVAAIED